MSLSLDAPSLKPRDVTGPRPRTPEAVAFATTTVLAATLGACADHQSVSADPTPTNSAPSTGTPSSDPGSPPSTAPSPTPATTATAGNYDTTWSIADVATTDEVTSAYGQDLVDDAYQTVVDLTEKYAFDPDAAIPHHPVPKPVLLHAATYMTDECAADYAKKVNALLAGDKSAGGPIEVVTYFGLGNNDPAWDLTPDGPTVIDQRITRARASASDNGGLAVTITAKAEYRESYNGKPYLAPVTKTVTFTVMQTPRNGKVIWLVDTWDGTSHPGPTRPDHRA